MWLPGGERDFSHSLIKSDENLLMLLGASVFSRADGNSPSLPDWGEGDRSSARDRFRLL